MGKLPSGSLKNYTHKNILRIKQAIDKLPILNSFRLFSDQGKTEDFGNGQKQAVSG